MTVYEMRTYTLHVGKMAEAVKLVEGFAVKFRPLLASQEVKLLTAAPWGPHP